MCLCSQCILYMFALQMCICVWWGEYIYYIYIFYCVWFVCVICGSICNAFGVVYIHLCLVNIYVCMCICVWLYVCFVHVCMYITFFGGICGLRVVPFGAGDIAWR